MANGIRTGDPRGFNKGRSSKFRVGSRVRQTPEEGRRTYQPKRRGNNNKKDEDNGPKTLNDKNHQASSQKFRQPVIRSRELALASEEEIASALGKQRVTNIRRIFIRKGEERIQTNTYFLTFNQPHTPKEKICYCLKSTSQLL